MKDEKNKFFFNVLLICLRICRIYFKKLFDGKWNFFLEEQAKILKCLGPFPPI